MEYRVHLDVYDGPLDLLLHLIRRDELDIHDIPIARITDSYCRHIAAASLHGTDLNTAGEFLVMAATLMEIKSATLLPRPPPSERQAGAAAEPADPRSELVRQLLEYKRFKDSAGLLEAKAREQASRFARVPAHAPLPAGQEPEPPPVDLDEVQVYDLLAAFSRLMREVGQRGPSTHDVLDDDTPLALHAADIEDRLARAAGGAITLRSLLTGRRSRGEMIGVFLAILELVRQKRILVAAIPDADDFELSNAPPEHRATYQESPPPPV